jgi:hypothetical protein
MFVFYVFYLERRYRRTFKIKTEKMPLQRLHLSLALATYNDSVKASIFLI